MSSRDDIRRTLPIESQVKMIHADLDQIDEIIDRKLDTLEAKMDKMMIVFITGTLSLVVALMAALATALTVT